MSTPRPRRWLRWTLFAVLLLLLLPLGAVAVFALTFDANAWKPRIEAAVEAATGRAFRIAGPIGTKLSLRPTVTLEGASLANPPGFSRPAMAEVKRAEVELSLLPLLSRRIALHRLVLEGADVMLEKDARGTPNWVLARPAQPGPAPAPAPPAAPGRPFGLEVDQVVLAGSSIAYRARPQAAPQVLAVRRLGLSATEGARTLKVEGSFAHDGRALALEGETGPLAALMNGEAAPWPLRLALTAEGGLALRAEGTLTPPASYRLTVNMEAADLAALAPLLPDQPLPPLKGVAAQAELVGQGGLPAVRQLSLRVGESDLNVFYGDLVLERATLRLPALDEPLRIEAAARIGTTPLALEGSLGAPLRLLLGGTEPWPVRLAATSPLGRLGIAGGIAEPRAGTGFDLALTASAPDLAAVAPLLPQPVRAAVPALRDVSLDLRIAERGAFFEQGAELRDLRFASSAGDVAGALTYATRPRQGFVGELTSRRLDLDAMRAALAVPAAPGGRPPGAGAPAPAAPAAADRRVIPDLALPLDTLRITDSDLRFNLAAVRAEGMEWREVSGRLVLKDGQGRLDPLVATLDGAGRLSLRAAADITAQQPTVQAALRTEGLNLAAIPAAGGAAGRLGVEADLRGRGRDLRSLAASAYGHLGLTLQGGSLPPHMLGGLLAGLSQRVPGVGELAARPLELSCVAARLEAQDGIAHPRVLLAETSLGRLGAGDGAGTVNLREERFDLRLNTDLRLPVPGLPQGLRIRAPVPLTGSFAAPRLEWNAAAGSALQGEVADRAERALGREAGALLGALGGALAGRGGEAAAPSIPDCGAAVALARGQAAPPAPASPPPAAAAPAPAPSATPPARQRDPVQDFLNRGPLRGLLGR